MRPKLLSEISHAEKQAGIVPLCIYEQLGHLREGMLLV